MSYSCLKHGWTHVYEGCPLCVRTTQSSSSRNALSNHEGHLLGCLTCQQSKVYNLSVALAAEKERADSWQENCEAERARDDQFDWVVGECTHGLIGSYSTCNGGNGCERSRFLHCCFCMKRDFNSKEQARKWERQCVVRGDQWETEKSRAEKAEKERDEFREECHRIDGRLLKAEKELAELKTPLKDWDARLAEKNVAMSKRNAEITALTEKLREVRKNITKVLESMTATQYAFQVVWPEIEKIGGPDWDEMKAGMNQEYALLGDAIEVSKLSGAAGEKP